MGIRRGGIEVVDEHFSVRSFEIDSLADRSRVTNAEDGFDASAWN
jgi:hypothetical protein